MAKGVILTDRDNQRTFYWNTHANVGPGCPNRTDDVQLVQLGYACLATRGSGLITDDPELVSLARMVVPGSPYSGSPTDALTMAIRRHQLLRGAMIDGRVSSITAKSGEYAAGQTWMLVPLNTRMGAVLGTNSGNMPNLWPKIHLHPLCPAALAAISRTVFTLPAVPIV
jgi:hypothetical protein